MEAAARGAAARRLPSWIYLDLAYTANYLFWINGDKRVAYFKRTKLAAELAAKLLHPGALDLEMRSGLFIAGQRRTGKTTFLRQDLIPALEQLGAIVIYVDLWSDTKADPASLVNAAVRRALEDMQVPGSGIWDRLKRLKGVDVGAAGFNVTFHRNQATSFPA